VVRTRYLTPLAAAAALLIAGAYSYASEEIVPGTSLLVSGLIVLGVWLGEARNEAPPERRDDGR